MVVTERDLIVKNSNSYQLRREDVDVLSMIDQAEGRLPQFKKQALAAILRSSVWGEDFPSVKSMHIRTQYRDYSRERVLPCQRVYPLEPNTGAINVPSHSLYASELGKFFTPLRVKGSGTEDFTELRGLTYYTAVDFSKNTPAKKLAVMAKDTKEGLELMGSVDRRNLNQRDYLLFLGILDHLKSHSITAFHALTYHERKGEIPEDGDYLPIRKQAQEVMFALTRAYYQACLGKSFDSDFKASEIERSAQSVADYISNSGHTIVHFTLPEVINPLTIILGAHETARKKVYPDVLIGIPSGGTEVAIATSLMYENLFPNLGMLDTKLVPLSFHYQAQGGISSERLAEMLTLSMDLVGKHALIVDDNSNTGSTLQVMSEAVMKAGASRIQVHIAEIDTDRIRAKYKKGEFPYGVVNLNHPDLETAMGISEASEDDGSDSRRKYVRKFIKKIHEHTEKRMTNGAES